MNNIGGDCLLADFVGGGRNGLGGRAIFCVNWQNGEAKAGQGGGQDAGFDNHGLNIGCNLAYILIIASQRLIFMIIFDCELVRQCPCDRNCRKISDIMAV